MLNASIHSFPVKPADKKTWTGLKGSAKACAIIDIVNQHQGFCVVLTDHSGMALSLESQCRFYSPETPILHFPDWETLPYDHFSPHQDIVSERLNTLYQLTRNPKGILFVPVNTLLARICPRAFLDRHHFRLSTGDTLDLADFKRRLEETQYQRVSTVYEHGEYTIRGGIIDLFPMGSATPLRLELFDDEIETIKTFDPDTQRTIKKIDFVEILPAREFPLDATGLATFKDNWYAHFDTALQDTDFYADLQQFIGFPGIEYYLPLFFEETFCLLDYLPKESLLICTDNIGPAARQFLQDTRLRYEQYNIDRGKPLLKPDTLFFREEEINQRYKAFPSIVLTDQQPGDTSKGYFDFSTALPPDISIDSASETPYARLEQYLRKIDRPVLFCAESLGRREVFFDMFRELGITYTEIDSFEDFLTRPAPVSLTVSPMDEGVVLPGFAVIVESRLFGTRVQQQRRRKKIEDNSDTIIKSLTELKLGSPVVHLDHGIGRYLGLKVIEVDGNKNEFLYLQYANEATLYVPVANLHLISRYAGAENADQVTLHRLGSDQWEKARKKAAEKAHDVAAELLDIYARRAARKGFAHDAASEAYKRFAEGFPFEETDDQTNAIARVLEDMAADKPMDRLICGDVGFGKTEVAMRAAFTAVHNNKQVAILVPTTLLAQQHFSSFQDRFADQPVTVEVLSRFKSAKAQEGVIEKLKAGKIDILIGTHKLLQGSVQFRELGLVIIDEEHRFGVKQKEVLKSLRSEVDVLAMTATPIPRTLNMSMAGIRDISIIATPPAKRLSIKTFVHRKNSQLIKEAVLRELLRGGQVYYLYNEVSTIENMARELSELLPEARIGIGHGQMRERELESVMQNFYHKRFNILLCTTIIETGIDVPSANTIIIDRADKFGLAQLHQLRGRVGRSHHQAYAYLLTPKDKKLTADAEKRLEAIQESSTLGAGFTLATHDLEIRGAGELLGDGQSGHIQTVGFSLYIEMLNQAVKSIQQGITPNINAPLKTGTEIDLSLSAIIPEDYLPDVHTRLIMYKKIANCEDSPALKAMKIEMIDRFGLLPEAVNHLFAITEIKLMAEKLGITRLKASAHGGKMDFANDTPVEPMRLISLIQKQPAVYQMGGANSLKFTHSFEEPTERIQGIHAILSALQ